MSEAKQTALVIAISAPSGGGKTTLVKKVAEMLDEAISVFFDDYDDSTIHPPDLGQWVIDGADYNTWKTPQLRQDLHALKFGRHLTGLGDGQEPKTPTYIIFDGPMGRAQRETAYLIDFMVYIDTPLDIAMARRLLRTLNGQTPETINERLNELKSELRAYLKGGRAAYLEMDKQIKPACDLVLDGPLPVEALAQQVVMAIRQHFPCQESGQ